MSVIDAVEWHSGRPFEWGVSDCGILFADAVVASGGADPLEGIRGYTPRRGAAAALRAAGFSSVADLVSARLREIAPAEARPGDVGFQAQVCCAFSSPAVILGREAISKDFAGRVVISRGTIARAYTWRS